MKATTFLAFVSMALLMSCTSQVELDTLDTQIDHQWENNLFTLRQFVKDIDDSGNRPSDLEVLSQIQSFLEMRKVFFSAEISDSLDVRFPIKEAMIYVDSLQRITKDLEVEQCETYFGNIERMAKEELSGTAIRKRLIYLNILQIEHQILNWGARKIGSDCGFCYGFNLSSNRDTLVVGEQALAILSVSDKTTSIENFEYQEVKLVRDSEEVPITFKSIKSSGILEFIPAKAGKYTFSGDLQSSFVGVEFVYSCRFRFDIMVKDSIAHAAHN